MSRPLPLFPSALALQLLSQAISYCPSWDKQVPSNEALAPGSLCPRPAGVTADLSLFGCTGLLAEQGILRTQAWRHGSRAWGSLFSAAGRRTTTLRLRRRSTPAPPSSLLAASAAGRGATRAGPRWARSGSGLTTVILPGRLSGRAGCHSRPGRDRLRAGSGSLCSPLSFAGRRAGVRPTPGSRLPPGTLAGALDPLRRFAPSGTGASRRVLTGVASGPDVVSGPPGAPSQSGATSPDWPVLWAHLGRRRRAGPPEGTVFRFILVRSQASASQSALQRSRARASSVSRSRRRRARAFQVGPATGPARRCLPALLHSAGGGLTGLSPAPHTGLGSLLRAAGRTTGPAGRGDSENGPGIALRFATRNTNQVSHALPHSQPDLGARASCSPCFPCI